MTSERKERVVVRRLAKSDLKTRHYTQSDFAHDREVAQRFFQTAKEIFPQTPTQRRMQSSRG
jgi:hypothetical protein